LNGAAHPRVAPHHRGKETVVRPGERTAIFRRNNDARVPAIGGRCGYAASGSCGDVRSYYDVSRYYEQSAAAGATDKLDGAVLQLMPCPPQADTQNFASAGGEDRKRGPD
jgi:hypothetical protein